MLQSIIASALLVAGAIKTKAAATTAAAKAGLDDAVKKTLLVREVMKYTKEDCEHHAAVEKAKAIKAKADEAGVTSFVDAVVSHSIYNIDKVLFSTKEGAVTEMDSERTILLRWMGAEHVVHITRTSSVGLAKVLPRYASCIPMRGQSFVFVSDEAFNDEFVVMHEVGHSVQSLVLERLFGRLSIAVMGLLNVGVSNQLGGFPLEPHADAFALRATKKGWGEHEALLNNIFKNLFRAYPAKESMKTAAKIVTKVRTTTARFMPLPSVEIVEMGPVPCVRLNERALEARKGILKLKRRADRLYTLSSEFCKKNDDTISGLVNRIMEGNFGTFKLR